jgi:hypothetical protein
MQSSISNLPSAIIDLLQELLAGVRGVLGPRLVGMYLEGSLANGGFDAASDIDFIAATLEEVTGEQFAALQAMHDRLARLDNPWAIQLEGSYISLAALRRYDPAHATHPNIERGEGERLKIVHHDYSGVVHRSILWEQGITLAGPPPRTLVDPVTPDDLRLAVRETLPVWGGRLVAGPSLLHYHGYRCYAVLTICRMLYTLQHGQIVPKAVAARWAQQALGPRWAGLIERAWAGRIGLQGQTTDEDGRGALEFLQYALDGGKE